jgi:hypothetical protein
VPRWLGLSVLSMIELGELIYRLVRKRIALLNDQRSIHPAEPQVQSTKVKMAF